MSGKAISVLTEEWNALILRLNAGTQIIYAKIDGDYVLGQAKSSELARYGLAAGYKNYAASYSTGLLLARRVSVPTFTP